MSSSSELTSERPGATASELEKLRDILYGEQARAVEQRLNEFYKELLEEIDSLRKDQAANQKSGQGALENAQAALNGRIDNLAAENSEKMAILSKGTTSSFGDVERRLQAQDVEMNEKLDEVMGLLEKQDAQFTQRLDATDQRLEATTQQLEATGQRLEEQEAEFLDKLSAAEAEILKQLQSLNARLEQFNVEQSARSDDLQKETRQLDQELRQQLSEALLELGRLLQGL